MVEYTRINVNVQELLFEATFDVDQAVEVIYDEVFSLFIDRIQDFKKGGIFTYRDLDIDNKVYSWEELVRKMESEQIKKALTKTKISLHAGVFYAGSSYSPTKKMITVSFSQSLYDLLERASMNSWTFDIMMDNLPDRYHTQALNEFNGSKVKGTIAHELSHWLGDVYHNGHISKMIGKMGQTTDNYKARKMLNRGNADPYQADYEIDAMIHSLAQLKKSMGQGAWDTLTFNEMINSESGIYATINRLKDMYNNEESKFMKTFIKRMRREGLIGKSMTGKMKL